jgi:N-acetylated-alpha-linked acidic dipeptidase
MMIVLTGMIALWAWGALVWAAPPADSPTLQGFSSDSARAQREWETKFRAIPDTHHLRDYMQRLSARPHHLGSPYDKENAEWILSKFQQWGLDARLETFDVLFPTPKERAVELVEPVQFTAKLQEPAMAGDPTSGQHDEQLPTYNAYSIDGDVTAPLVYVNYGVPDDYEQLERMGVSVKGAIVIARYGACWRGTKPKVAAEHGAVGCLIYSDPREDGYFQDEVFPDGPSRPRDGVQRGSVMEIPVCPGDPLTPGIGATANAKRLRVEEAKTLTKVPVLPISSADAQPLLAALRGPVAPEGWRGALPLTYHVGPGPARVHLKVKSNWNITRIYNVIATLPGSTDPDEWIIRGNHHDAWVNGAADPVSGVSALMEEARGLAQLVKQGWKPKRTIVYCLWDGEEEGMLGSIEWVEEHAEELGRKAVAYLNTDSCARGYLSMSGSHTLEKFINGVARDITDPEKNIPVWKRLQLATIARSAAREEVRSRPDLRIGALGSGSDFAGFLDHLGIACLDLGYGGESSGGPYHSIYDGFYAYSRFGDPAFAYCRALSQTVGTAVMRLAGADLLPFDFSGFADTVRRYADELQKLAKEKRDGVIERNRQLDEGVFDAIADPQKVSVPPRREAVPPFLNFALLENALATLARATEHYNRVLGQASADGGSTLAGASLREVNAALLKTERALTLPDGLPNRPWFKHQIYAPGLYTGYGVKTIPAVREAIEQGRWQEANEQIVRVGKVLENFSETIEVAAAALERAIR